MADVTQAVGKLVVAVTTAQGTIPLRADGHIGAHAGVGASRAVAF